MKLTHAAYLIGFLLFAPATSVAAITENAQLQSIASVRSVGPRETIQAIVQDSQGFIWTAGVRGVCCYDGFAWACPSSEPASFLAADARGGVWTATRRGDIGRLFTTAEQVQHVAKVSSITSLVVDANNTLWVGSNRGLARLSNDTRKLEWAEGITGPVVSLATNHRRSLLVATSEQVFVHEGENAFAALWTPSVPIRAIAGGPGGSVAVAMRNDQVWQLGGEAGPVLLETGFDPSTLTQLPLSATLGPLTFDAKGRIWIAEGTVLLSLGSGNETSKYWDLSLDLSTFKINTLFVDNQGSLWVGSDTGLVQVRFNVPFRTLPEPHKEKHKNYAFSITQHPNGDIWSGTLLGVTRWIGGKPTFYGTTTNGFRYPDIRSLAVSEDGSVWAAGMSSGVFRFEGEAFVPVMDKTGARAPGTSSIRPKRGGGLWVGAWNGGLGTIQLDGFEWLFHPTVGEAERILDMVEAADGTLWMVTRAHGLLAWRNGEQVPVEGASNIPHVQLPFIHQTGDGEFWIGTQGVGLIHYDGQRARTIGTRDGLESDYIASMAEDGLGNFWLGSSRGVFVVRIDELRALVAGKLGNVSCINFGPEDGVTGEPTSSFAPSALRTADGKLIFPTSFGALMTDPGAMRATSAPKVVIQAISVDGKKVDIGKEVLVPAKAATNVVVEFSAPTFIAPHRLRFRYRLEGAESAWSETQTRRLRLERLPRGRHHLRIQAFHPGTDSGPPEETSISLVLLTPWHQRLWVQLAVVALMGAAFADWMRRRSRRRQEADAAIIAERARIAHEIHDGLEQDLCGLRLQIQAAGKALGESPEKARESLERAGELVSDASVDLRMAIWKLQLDATNSAELLLALEERLRRATIGTEVSLHTHASGPAKPLPVGIASHLVAITREAVANTLKYASATQIEIRFDTSDAKQLLLEIVDNGKGKSSLEQDARPGSGGLGISGMRARARAMNGTLQILHPESGGTLVRLCIPLRRGRI